MHTEADNPQIIFRVAAAQMVEAKNTTANRVSGFKTLIKSSETDDLLFYDGVVTPKPFCLTLEVNASSSWFMQQQNPGQGNTQRLME